MKKLYLYFLLCLLFSHINAQWTNNTAKNTLVANKNSSDIQIANTSDGKTWIAFYSQRGNGYDMRAQLLDGAGKKLFGDTGLLVSNLFTGSATFVFNVCVDGEDNFIIASQAQKGNSYEAGVQKINTSGQLLWGTGVDLGPGLSPYPVSLSNNDIVVAWNNDNKIAYQVISADGTVQFLPYKQLSGSGNSAVSRAQIVAGKNAKFNMVYQQTVSFPFYTNLYAQQFNRNGEALWGKPVKISKLVTASYRYYDLLASGDTTYIGYYGNPANKNRFDAYVQKVNPNGSLPWGIDGSLFADYVTDNDFYEQTIYINKRKSDNNIWAVCTFTNSFQTASGVYAQNFDAATGNRLLGNKASAVTPVDDNLISLAFSHLALCSKLPLFLVTDASNKIGAIKLFQNGKPAWPDVTHPVATSSNGKSRYAFTDVKNDQAVAVWQEDRGKGDKPYAQNVLCNDDEAVNSKPVINDIAVLSIHPNPATDKMIINIQSPATATVQLYITDVNGNVKLQLQKPVRTGNNGIEINVSRLTHGTYFIKILNKENSRRLLFQKN